MGAKLEGFPQLMQPLPEYSEDYRERTSGTSVQLPVFCQNSEDPRRCKATRDNQRTVFDACFAIKGSRQELLMLPGNTYLAASSATSKHLVIVQANMMSRADEHRNVTTLCGWKVVNEQPRLFVQHSIARVYLSFSLAWEVAQSTTDRRK